MVFAGTQSEDAYAQVKAMVQANFSPKFLFFANGANSPTEFPDKVGADNTKGIFSCGDWFPNSTANGNPAVRGGLPAKYGGKRSAIDSDSAEAYAVGQLVEAVANKTKLDRQPEDHRLAPPREVADARRRPELGPVRVAEGSDMLVEWIDGKLLPVYPPDIALHDAGVSEAGLGRLGAAALVPA